MQLVVTRDFLVSKNPCSLSLAVWDKMTADSGGTLDMEWSPLADAWLAVAYPSYSAWCREEGIFPQVNLTGANLAGADLAGANLTGAYL